MKKILLSTILLVLLGLGAYAQSGKEAIQKEIDNYLLALENRDVDKILDYVYPKLFDLAPRAMMKDMMESFYKDSTITFQDSKIENISEIIEQDTIQYALIDYAFTMVSLVKDEFGATESEEGEENEEDGFDPASMFKMMYGEENVKYDKKARKIYINQNKQMFAILDPAYEGGWKFLENQKDSPFIGTMIPEEVQKQF